MVNLATEERLHIKTANRGAVPSILIDNIISLGIGVYIAGAQRGIEKREMMTLTFIDRIDIYLRCTIFI